MSPISTLELTPVAGGTSLRLRVKPGARKTAIVGVHGGALKVQVNVPPERGKANEAVIALLAEVLDLSSTDVRIVAGERSQDKVAVVALSAATVLSRLTSRPSAP